MDRLIENAGWLWAICVAGGAAGMVEATENYKGSLLTLKGTAFFMVDLFFS